MAKTIKALRSTVEIGSLSVSGLMMPCGAYRMSDTDICEAIGEPSNSISNFRKSTHFKALLEADLPISEKPEKLKIEGYNKAVNASSLETASQFWLFKASSNPRAFLFCQALMQETIERRFDRAFNQKVEEEEYDRKLKERMQGKLIRRTFTDAIKAYLERHNDLSENRVKFMYSNASNAVNRAIFARPAKKLCVDFQVSDADLLRDKFNKDELRYIGQLEDLAMRLVDQNDADPVEAVKEAESRLLIPVSDRCVA